MDIPTGQRKFTDEEKHQLIANLDIEGQFPFYTENRCLNNEILAATSRSSDSPV
jgi:hypothetical protein